MSRYNLKALVQDRGHPDWECTSLIEINLEDVNDNAPQFTLPIFIVAVAEDVPVGSLISKVHAVDRDLGMLVILLIPLNITVKKNYNFIKMFFKCPHFFLN